RTGAADPGDRHVASLAGDRVELWPHGALFGACDRPRAGVPGRLAVAAGRAADGAAGGGCRGLSADGDRDRGRFGAGSRTGVACPTERHAALGVLRFGPKSIARMKDKLVTLIGGGGFLGRYVA